MEGKIVYQGNTKSDLDIIIRYPQSSDAEKMMHYLNSLSDERTFVRFQGEHLTLQEETNFLKSLLKKISDHKSVLLLVFSGEKLIGISGIELGDKIDRHLGVFGISIAKEFRDRGIGKLLMETIEKEAMGNLNDLEIITLGVFASNTKAIEIYKRAGYLVEGKLPKGVKLENGYDDHIFMYKVVKYNER